MTRGRAAPKPTSRSPRNFSRANTGATSDGRQTSSIRSWIERVDSRSGGSHSAARMPHRAANHSGENRRNSTSIASIPNPPAARRTIDLKLDELAQSIRANGVIQPVISSHKASTGLGQRPRQHAPTARYEIIAGETALARRATSGPAQGPVVVATSRTTSSSVALIENISART